MNLSEPPIIPCSVGNANADLGTSIVTGFTVPLSAPHHNRHLVVFNKFKRVGPPSITHSPLLIAPVVVQRVITCVDPVKLTLGVPTVDKKATWDTLPQI